MTESEKDAQARWIIRQDLPACVCAPTNPKHREGWHCVTKVQLTEWAKHEPCYFTNPSDRKRACWVWLWFSQHPEAKKLTGRDEPDSLTITTPGGSAFRSSSASAILGFDRWDDDAGMTEIQKEMFR